MLWTSGSLGSRSGGDRISGCSWTGLVRFGSSLALMALTMRRAWYLANLVLEAISGSESCFHMDMISRKVEAARSVSAVALSRH